MNLPTLEQAVYLLSIVEQNAWGMGRPVNIAIVDECGSLVAFHRMDNAILGGIDLAINKAWTSATMQMPTSDLARLALPGGDAYGVNSTNQGKVVILGGGIPLIGKHQILGGVGVSGGTGSAQDIRLAEAAVRAFNRFGSRNLAPVPGVQAQTGCYQEGAQTGKTQTGKITLALVKRLMAASVQKASQMGLRCDIAIVDEGGNLVAFYRMDHARVGDIAVSQDKAWSSVALQLPTSVIAQMALPGGDLYGVNTTHQGRLAALGGGLPFVSRNQVAGGVGVSGGTSSQDEVVADAAVQLFHYLVDQGIKG